jgi:hypothetical protein
MKKKERKDKLKYKNKIRKQQLEKAISDTEQPDENCGISDETMARMQDQLTEQYGIGHEMVRDSSLEKMSDALLEYGKPFIDLVQSDSKADYEKSIKISMMLWNCSIMQDVKGPGGRKEIEKMLKPVMPDAESKEVVRYMLERKRQMFPDNNRIILNYELAETPDGFHLSVASTIPPSAQ